MRKTLLPITAAVFLLPAVAGAQIAARMSAGIDLNLPVILPPVVVIAPGVQVVPEVEHEVFLVNGVYWARHPKGWYKSKSHRGGWVLVPARGVPARLVSLQPGKYKRWKPAKHDHGVRDHGRGEGRWGGGDDRRDHRDGRGGDDRRGHDRDEDDNHGRGGKHKKHGKH
jgi:hypothetical protein